MRNEARERDRQANLIQHEHENAQELKRVAEEATKLIPSDTGGVGTASYHEPMPKQNLEADLET